LLDSIIKLAFDCGKCALEGRVRVLLLLELKTGTLPHETESDRDDSEEKQDGQTPISHQREA